MCGRFWAVWAATPTPTPTPGTEQGGQPAFCSCLKPFSTPRPNLRGASRLCIGRFFPQNLDPSTQTLSSPSSSSSSLTQTSRSVSQSVSHTIFSPRQPAPFSSICGIFSSLDRSTPPRSYSIRKRETLLSLPPTSTSTNRATSPSRSDVPPPKPDNIIHRVPISTLAENCQRC